MKNNQFVGRKEEINCLIAFYQTHSSEFLHVRGRRRIGKSWLLQELQRRIGGLYFHGEQDSSTQELQATFARLWDEFVGQQHLSIIRQRDLNWDIILSAITEFARLHQNKKILLMFDEIHWIAKRNTGFTSKIKKAWLSWERMGNIKVIICGSSNRFFDDKTSKESSILRGLRTQADIWVQPFSLSEVKHHFFPEWTQEEICLVYMMVGGVPYYLNRIPAEKNFIRAINKAFFTRTTIFFDELDEVINLEFNKSSKTKIKTLLAALGQEGRTITSICQKTKISESSVRENIEKLVSYGLVFEKKIIGVAPKKNKAGSKYYMRDFYLNFYFQVLDRLKVQIKHNEKNNIFSNLLLSKEGYYIPDFSGPAFEHLIESVIALSANKSMSERVFNKLGIQDKSYNWGHYWEYGTTQIDLIIESTQDRESRILEAKWLSTRASIKNGFIEQVIQKSYVPPRGFRLSFYLVLSQPPTKELLKAALKQEVKIIELKDLF